MTQEKDLAFTLRAPALWSRRLVSSTHYAQNPPLLGGEAQGSWYWSPTSIDTAHVLANLYEVGELLRPVTHWQIDVVPGPTLTYHLSMFQNFGFNRVSWDWNNVPAGERSGGMTLVPNSNTIRVPFSDLPAAAIWRGTPAHVHSDMGARPDTLETPLNADAVGAVVGHISDPPAVYLVPGGFRCAR